jgi:CHAT domain-containing protein
MRRASRRARTHRLFGPLRSSSIAEAFLDGGVANFLGTHWPVGDEAALLFSTRLYEALLDGARLGDAVLAARLRVFQSGSIDWADYVHYGNPAFLLGDFGPPQSR